MAEELGKISGSISIDYDGGGVDKAKKDVDGLEDQSRKSTAAIAGFFGGMAAGIATAVANMAVNVGTSLAGGITDAVLETEKSRDRLQAQLGDVDWAGKAGKAAGSLYSHAWGESLQEVNDAVRAVLQGGLLGGDATQREIEGITAKVIDLSDAFGQDVNQTVRAATQLVRTGLAQDGGEALDILTVGFQKTGDLAGDLLDTFNEYGTQFRKLGIDGQQAVGLFTQGLEAGARDIDVVADALKEFSIRAIDGTELTAEGFKALGLNAETMSRQIAAGGDSATEGLAKVLDRLRAMEDPVKRDAAAVALFGTQAEDLGGALLALDPTTATDSLGQVTGAAGELSDTLNQGAGVQLEAFKRQIQEALVRRLAQAIPTIKAVLSILAEAFGWLDRNALPILKKVGQFIADNKTPILVISGIIAAVFIPHWVALGVAATVAAAKTVAAWVVMRAQAIAGAAVHSAQILLMIGRWAAWGAVMTAQAARGAAAIGLVIARFAALAVANAIMGAIRVATLAWTAAQWLLNVALTANPIGIIIVAIAALIAIIVLIATKTTFFHDLWQWVWERIGGTVKAVWNVIWTVIKTGLDILIAYWKFIFNLVVTVFTAIWKGIVAYVKFYINLVRTIISTVLNVIKTIWTTAWNTVRNVINTVINAIRNIVQSGINRVKAIINGVRSIINTVRNAFQSAKDAAVGRLNSLIGFVKGIPNRIKNALGNLKNRLFSAGQDIIRGLIDGIKNMVGAAAQAAKDAVAGAIDSAKNFLGIGSPSKLFRDEVGAQIPLGLAQGVKLTADVPRREVERMVVALGAAPAPSSIAMASTRGSDGAGMVNHYTLQPGAIQVDASKLKSFGDVVNLLDNLRSTSRQFVRRS